MNVYLGEPHEVLARIHHDELIAEAQHHRRLRELRAEDREVRASQLRRAFRRVSAALALHPEGGADARYRARPTS
ncbi:hypothetical protein [Georgenia subflava]|uniref:Uncharacterized protein n=1 Tax=Georgenia subflava TaxID=1622177 RepID=A0A6N7EFJ6_9MICO|nr:hypothetical protein [Georgenia subflava]MPV36161.1 hypothetical protein [Georgenia subflava]